MPLSIVTHHRYWCYPGSTADIRPRHARVYLLHTMDDSFLVHDHLTNKNPKSAVIVGAGYIGLEMADALVHRGLEVTLISRPSEVLSTVDPELGQLVRKELVAAGYEIILSSFLS